MADVIPRFRPTVRQRLEAKAKKKSAASKRPGMSEKHLVLIRQLPCCVSGRHAPSDPHHLKQGLSHERGVGRKATDRWAVPLSRMMHDQLEALGSTRELEWFRSHGIEDPLEFANALWANTGDLQRMLQVQLVHMQGFKRD